MERVGHLEQRQQEGHHKLPLAVVAYQVPDDVAFLVGVFMLPVGCLFASVAAVSATAGTGDRGGVVVIVVVTVATVVVGGGDCRQGGGVLHPIAGAVRGWTVRSWTVAGAAASAVAEWHG